MYVFFYVLLFLLLILCLWWLFSEQVVDFFLNRSNIAILNYHQSLNPAERGFDYYRDLVGKVLVRFCLLWSFVSLLLWFFWHVIQKQWVAFLYEPASPYALSVFRIVAFGSLLLYTEPEVILKMSKLPVILIDPPLGWSRVLQTITPNFNSVGFLLPIFELCLVMALLGYRVRLFGSVAVLMGVWVLGIPQFYGKINHYHHLLWFGMIASIAPSSEVWSLDARRGIKVVGAYVHRYYLRLILASLFVIYFFAGCWKIIGCGPEFLWGNIARHQIELQAVTLGLQLPKVFIDYPIFYKLIALLTVIIEIFWGWWMLQKKSRYWMMAVTVMFHLSILLIMDINFWILPVFLLVFLPYHQFFKRVVGEDKSVETRDPEKFSKNHWSRWYLGIIMVFGFFHIDTWPFAVYPSFGNPVEPITWHVSLEYKRSDGFHKVNLIGDQKLRKWLPKTRLLGLHKQLLSKDPKSISKLKALDRFYCEALSLNMDQPRTYIKRKKNITTGEILDSCVLLDLP